MFPESEKHLLINQIQNTVRIESHLYEQITANQIPSIKGLNKYRDVFRHNNKQTNLFLRHSKLEEKWFDADKRIQLIGNVSLTLEFVRQIRLAPYP